MEKAQLWVSWLKKKSRQGCSPGTVNILVWVCGVCSIQLSHTCAYACAHTPINKYGLLPWGNSQKTLKWWPTIIATVSSWSYNEPFLPPPFPFPHALWAQMAKPRLGIRNVHSSELRIDVNECSVWSAVLCMFVKNTGTDTTHLLPLLPQHYFFHLFEFWLHWEEVIGC